MFGTCRVPFGSKEKSLYTSFSPSRSLCCPFWGLWGSNERWLRKILIFWMLMLWATENWAWTGLPSNHITPSLGDPKLPMKNYVFEAKSSQDGSWGDLGSIWVAKRGRLGRPLEGQVGSKKGRKSDAKKGLVLVGLGGGWRGLWLGHLGPGVIRGRPRYRRGDA